ncbi:hypothetical protein DBA29_22365 [Xenophilus aerolatus]|nr:hypothetical protein [Xenophilus aerolatus]
MKATTAPKRARQHARRTQLAHAHPVATAIAKKRMAEHMTTISIAIYMAADGEPERELLAHLGWMLGIGAEIAAQLGMVGPLVQLKRQHAALRTVLQMSEQGAWQAAQAPVLCGAATEAKDLLIAHPAIGATLIESADWLASRIRNGDARLSDVSGAELYSNPPQGLPQ